MSKRVEFEFVVRGMTDIVLDDLTLANMAEDGFTYEEVLREVVGGSVLMDAADDVDLTVLKVSEAEDDG